MQQNGAYMYNLYGQKDLHKMNVTSTAKCKLQMNDQDLHVVKSHKHLGVIISDNGQWNGHIDYIVKKTYNRLNIMRKSRTFLDRYSLENIYISFIRPFFNGVR